MDHSNLMGERLAQQQQQELARTLELRRRISERRQAQEPETGVPAPAEVQGWRGLLVRAHLVRPLTH